MSIGEDDKSSRPATFLYIRYDALDEGKDRPIPNGVAYWHSPDIWVTDVDALGNPVGGEPTEVKARIWNMGSLEAAPLRVDFWFIAPSLGIGASAPKKIGTGWSLGAARGWTVVTCGKTWTPPVTDAGTLHACVIATCSSPALVHPDMPLKPSTPVDDRHTGQRNLTVMEATAGEQIGVPVRFVNPLERPAGVALLADAAWQRTFDHATPQKLDAAGVKAPTDSRERLAVDAESLGALLALAKLDSATAEHELEQVAAQRQAGEVFHPIGHVSGLGALQSATAHFVITVPHEPQNGWLVVNLAQATHGVVGGGYTVAIRVKRA